MYAAVLDHHRHSITVSEDRPEVVLGDQMGRGYSGSTWAHQWLQPQYYNQLPSFQAAVFEMNYNQANNYQMQRQIELQNQQRPGYNSGTVSPQSWTPQAQTSAFFPSAPPQPHRTPPNLPPQYHSPPIQHTKVENGIPQENPHPQEESVYSGGTRASRKTYQNSADEKPYLCPVLGCGLRYRYKGDLKVHVKRKHEGVDLSILDGVARPRSTKQGKACACPYPGCPCGFTHRRDLLRHFRKKHPDAPEDLRHDLMRNRYQIPGQGSSSLESWSNEGADENRQDEEESPSDM